VVDPITGAALVKAAASASEEAAKTTSSLLQRVLGPAADEIGEALSRYTAFRVGNVKRIAERADRKNRRPGSVPPRVAHRVLEDGSYCEDEVMVDYLSGVLAGSRSEIGSDDRGVAWSSLITSMSSLQLRAHYLLYREWAARLHGRTDIKMGDSEARDNAEILIELNEFYRVLAPKIPVAEASSVLNHAITGLARAGLIADYYKFGTGAAASDAEFELAVRCICTPQGIELFYWAMGRPELDPWGFTTSADPFEVEPGVPRLQQVVFPKLPAPPVAGAPGAALLT